MKKNCSKCGKSQVLTAFQRNNSAPDGRRTVCAICRNVAKPKRFTRVLTRKKYLITAAQNGTPVDAKFFDVLLKAAKIMRAELVVIPLRYKNPTSAWTASQQNAEWWAKEVEPYLFNVRKKLCANLVLCADVKVQPTAARPLSGFESLTGAESCIIGHPKMQFVSVPVPQGRYPKILSTTGACTQKNYTDSKAGKIGAFHHFLGAVIVEVEGKKFHLRQINADRKDGSFIDLEWRYTQSGCEKAPPALGLVLGDSHARVTDPKVDRATFGAGGIVETLKPKELVFHDVIDCETVNPHEAGNPFLAAAKQRAIRSDVAAEIAHCVRYINSRAQGRGAVIVDSNHPDFLARWILKNDWKFLGARNGEFYLKTALAMLRSAENTPNGGKYADPFAYWAKMMGARGDISFLGPNDSHLIGGIECGLHGHRGPNGVRGTMHNLARLGVRVITGHSHAPGIEEGHYKVGTSTPLRLAYNLGPSSWLNTHCGIYANGKRSLITIIDGKWRAG